MACFKEMKKTRKGLIFTICLIMNSNTNLLNVNTVVDKFSTNLRIDTPPLRQSKENVATIYICNPTDTR